MLAQEEWKKTPGAPYLYVNVVALKKSYGLYAYAIEVCLNQLVMLMRDQQTQEFAETWRRVKLARWGKSNFPPYSTVLPLTLPFSSVTILPSTRAR